MKDRILYLRKTFLHMSRESFASAIGMSGSEIRNIENGITVLKENKIPLLCSTYCIREEWLRTGEGEMIAPQSRGEAIGVIVKAAAQHDPEQALRFMLDLVSGLSDAEIVLLYEIFQRHFHPDK